MKMKLFWMSTAVLFTGLFASPKDCSITCNDITCQKQKKTSALAIKNQEKELLGHSPMAHFFLIEI